MNRYQSANSTLSFAVLAACVVGVNKWVSDNPRVDPVKLFLGHPQIVCLFAFIILLKVKIWNDDHHHFGEAVTETISIRIFGFVLAILSMAFFALAGYQISNPQSLSEKFVNHCRVSVA